MKILAGYGLQFLGLGLVVLAMFTAGGRPDLPFWVFLLLALTAGVPPMIWGGRLVHQGRQAAGTPPQQATQEYHRSNFRLALFVGYAFSWALVITSPMLLIGIGLIPWNLAFLRIWFGVGFLMMVIAHPIFNRFVYPRLERRALAWWDTRDAR